MAARGEGEGVHSLTFSGRVRGEAEPDVTALDVESGEEFKPAAISRPRHRFTSGLSSSAEDPGCGGGGGKTGRSAV